MDNNNQKWYQGKNFKIIILILISFIAIGTGFIVKSNLPQDTSITEEKNIPPFEKALSKGKEASILTQTGPISPRMGSSEYNLERCDRNIKNYS